MDLVSWVELQKLLTKIEDSTNSASVIHIKRQHLMDDRSGYDFRVSTHRRYNDKSILTASVAEDTHAKY